ncbi:aryl-sulfate sulfotransferase [Massilia sp. HP4]|uniref:aryl-sulfate sulfotransferase n=1 Tax=Massilia sp. HP4 TaxID=2562316 RepID=UPI00148525AA|nr:aryl-sulfate sulfotransferase [Massilia sp. HP4]
MKSPITLFLWILLTILLSACGGKDHDKTQAERAGIGAIAQAAGATPFVAQLSHTLHDFSHLDSVHYTIAARPGTHSRPVSVTYDRAWLGRRAAWDGPSERIAFPVFGLYANHRNELTLTTRFRDGSLHQSTLAVVTGAYTGPATLYATPEVRTARGAASPGFDYMLVKNGITMPVILDSDGQMRWAGAAVANSFSSLFGDDAFYLGDQAAPLLHRVDVDGSVRSSRLDDPRFTNFHHELARGKSGFLAELDAEVGGVRLIESILAEIDLSGRVLKEWDLGQIFRAAMRAGGDNPDNFVRDGVDWFHMNSAIYDAQDNTLLISSRENFVVKLDYDTGAIRWLLGDTGKHWYVNYPSLRALALRVTEGKAPIGQHSLSVAPNGELILFNNGLASFNQPAGAPAGQNRSYSTPSRYAIDDKARTAREVWTWDANRELLSDICSSTYEGAPGQYLVAYSSLAARTKARLVALDGAGQVAFDYAYPSEVCNTVFIAQPFRLDGLRLR